MTATTPLLRTLPITKIPLPIPPTRKILLTKTSSPTPTAAPMVTPAVAPMVPAVALDLLLSVVEALATA